ncbi:hypothetical protein SDC9_114642 [bioreactor metagenome]|uniref:Uncharacterized protein n=1 Tax=bioreactor metagenome TaxID=1076179 RepID=A0A645BRK2_9ZZZZ
MTPVPCAPRTPVRPSASRVGWLVDVTTVGWRSSISATLRASPRLSSGTRSCSRRAPTTCAMSTASRSPAWSRSGRRATPTRTCRPVRSRSRSASSRCSTRPPRCRSRSTSTSPSARRPGSGTATSICAGRSRPRRCDCVPRSPRRPVGCSGVTTSSRSRPRR